MLYGGRSSKVGWWQQHSYRETVATRIGGRMLTVVADGAEALIAHIPDSREASGVRTQSPVLTLVAEEYLIHELTLQRTKDVGRVRGIRSVAAVRREAPELTLGRTGRLSSIDPQRRSACA